MIFSRKKQDAEALRTEADRAHAEWDLIKAYRERFNSANGRVILADQLRTLGFFEKTFSEAAAHQRNAAIDLLEKLGICHEENLDALVDALLSIPPHNPLEDINAY